MSAAVAILPPIPRSRTRSPLSRSAAAGPGVRSTPLPQRGSGAGGEGLPQRGSGAGGEGLPQRGSGAGGEGYLPKHPYPSSLAAITAFAI
jgi:hypothetical protein